MFIYKYNETTKVFSEKVAAKVDPKDPSRFLVPQSSTTVAVPEELEAGENQVIVFNENADEWELVEDYTGKLYWINGIQKIMDTPGPLPVGGSLTAPVKTAAELLQEEREQAMNPFTTAFRLALRSINWPGHTHMLEGVRNLIEAQRAQDPDNDLVVWWDTVTQLIRVHPNIDAFRNHVALQINGQGISEGKVDAIFRVAVGIERGIPQAELASLIAAANNTP